MVLPPSPTRAARRKVLTIVASGAQTDIDLHGDTLAVLIGDGCIVLDGTVRNLAFSVTTKGHREMGSAERQGGEGAGRIDNVSRESHPVRGENLKSHR